MSCAGPARAPVPEQAAAPPASRAYQAAYILTWSQQRIGHATEQLMERDGGYALRREENISIRRGARTVHVRTAVHVALDTAMRPTAVRVERDGDGGAVTGRADRAADGTWRASFGGEAARSLPAGAVPLEILPVLLADNARYQGTVMLAGYGFATGELYTRPDPLDPHRVLASLVVPSGVLTNALVFDGDGLARVDAPGGVESYRVGAGDIAEPFDPPELVDSASIPVAGRPPRNPALVRLELDGVTAPEPPVLPAQALLASGTRWDVTLAAGFNSAGVDATAAAVPAIAPDPELSATADAIVRESGARTPTDELAALASYTDKLLENDLAAPATDARTAFALGRGDCTAHAAVFASFAAARGFEVRLVTGFRLSDTATGWRLIRHRWAIARVGSGDADRWIAVDPTYGEAPSAAVLLGLVVHGAGAGEIAMLDEVTFAGFADTIAKFR